MPYSCYLSKAFFFVKIHFRTPQYKQLKSLAKTLLRGFSMFILRGPNFFIIENFLEIMRKIKALPKKKPNSP